MVGLPIPQILLAAPEQLVTLTEPGRRRSGGSRGERVTRGGDHVFDVRPETLRAAFRAGFSRAPGVGHPHVGFRCAR